VLGANAQILATVPDGEDPLDFLVDEVADAKVVIDEEPETPTLSIDDATVAEGDAGTTTATFTVTLSEAPGSGETVTVDYATSDGTATAGTDYVAATGTLTFAEGETTKTIAVTVNGDTTFETDETFNVTLSNVTGTIGGVAAAIGDATGVGTITNDDEESFSLTTSSTDVISPDATDPAFKTTAGNDTITGNNSSIVSEGTLQATDKIDGGDGSDTAKFILHGAWTGFTTGEMKNVENVNLTNSTIAAFNFSAKGITGAEKYVIDATKASVTLTDLANLVELDVTGPAGTGNITADYSTTSTVWTGSQTDTQKLSVTNVGTANTKTDGTDNAKVGTVSIAKVEALEITTAGDANTLDLAAVTDAKSIMVAGAGTTQINAVGGAVTSFDASGATGNVIANLTGVTTAGALGTVKTGTGDDTITASTGDLKINALINGGTSGADKLVLDASAGGTLALQMSGIETLDVKTTSALTFSGSSVTDLATINFVGNTGGSNFLNMGATPLTVNTTGNSAGTNAIDTAAAVTYNMNASTAQLAAGTTAATAAANATFSGATGLTVNANELVASSGTITANAATSVTVNNASKVVNANELNEMSGALVANSATTVNIESSGRLFGFNIDADKATTMTLNTGSTASEADTVTVDATKLTTLNVTAKQDLTITESAGTSLDSVQNLMVTTDKAFAFAGDYLDDLASATLAGTASTSSANIGNLGGTFGAGTLTHNVNVTATGLKAGLTIGTVDAGTGSSTIDFSGVTGTVTLGNIDADAGVTLTGTNVQGAVAGTPTVASKGNISVDVTNAAKAVTLGTLNAGTTGDVSVLANNIAGALTVGAITGNNVTVNTKVAGAAVTEAGVTAKTSVNWTGADLFDDDVAIATGTGSTAFTATLAGGAMGEIFQITGGTSQTSITATGDLGAGTNRVDVTLGNSTATSQTVTLSGLMSTATAADSTGVTLGAGNYETNVVLNAETDGNIAVTTSTKDDLITLGATHAGTISITDSTSTDKDMLSITGALTTTKLTLSGIEGIHIGADATFINASAVSGQTIAITRAAAGHDLTLTGTAGNDTINLGNVTTDGTAAADTVVNGDAGNDIITGFKTGHATYNGGAGNDTITVSQGTNTIVTGAGNDTVELTGGTNTVTATNTASETTTIKATGGTTTVNMTGAADATVNASTSTAAVTINGTDGQVSTIIGGSGADTIDAGTGADIMSGGTGANTFVFAAGDNGAAPSATVFDTINDWSTGVGNKIDFGATDLTLVAEGTKGVGQAAISATGLATFDAADDTLAERIVAVEAAMTAVTAVAGETAVWAQGSDSYVFISDGTAGVDANDVLIKLTGVAVTTGLTVAAGDITAIA
jgi:hypothetical protein